MTKPPREGSSSTARRFIVLSSNNITDADNHNTLKDTDLAGDVVQTEGFQQVRAAHRYELIEDYLELIAELLQRHGRARQVQIAERLGVAQPTVAKMLKRLDREGYLVWRPYQGVALTDKGRALAEASRRRHQLIEAFLLALGVDEVNARRDAEGLEHHASQATLDAFRRYLAGQGWKED
ncbi:MAG: manganese-binding transcriptional regulator MntR [Lautropia sp.]|nr:manganese-binding transcriptional regulator MntR [Lautropia sp.]